MDMGGSRRWCLSGRPEVDLPFFLAYHVCGGCRGCWFVERWWSES